MNALVNRQMIKREQGFRLYSMCNEEIELVIVPELGARIVSLKNLRTGRELMNVFRPSRLAFGTAAVCRTTENCGIRPGTWTMPPGKTAC